MTEQELTQGISMLYDMETNNYLMSRTIEGLNEEIESLGFRKNYQKPVRAKTPVGDTVGASSSIFLGSGGVIGGIIGAIVGFSFENFDGFFNSFFSLLAVIIHIVIGALIGAGIGLGIGLIVGAILSAKKSTEIDQSYQNQCVAYDQAVANDQRRVQLELAQRQILIEQRETLQNRLQNSLEKTQEFYDMMGIDRKFRYLIPIGYMEEYTRLGIATKLTGIDGLYYLIKKELQFDVLQATLQQISEQLDELIDQQRDMYHELVSINNKCDGILQNTAAIALSAAKNNEMKNQILEKMDLIAYNEERVAKEISYQNIMNTWFK